jgi:hypothetical protein
MDFQEHSTKVKELSAKNDDLVKSQTDSSSTHAEALEKVKQVRFPMDRFNIV